MAADERRWHCPACGSDKVQALAWVELNSEAIDGYDDGDDYWCPQCEEHQDHVWWVSTDLLPQAKPCGCWTVAFSKGPG